MQRLEYHSRIGSQGQFLLGAAAAEEGAEQVGEYAREPGTAGEDEGAGQASGAVGQGAKRGVEERRSGEEMVGVRRWP
jgi:hypothetical protein